MGSLQPGLVVAAAPDKNSSDTAMHSREKEKKEKKETDLSGVKWKTNGHPLN
jgi:hypothetical protein